MTAFWMLSAGHVGPQLVLGKLGARSTIATQQRPNVCCGTRRPGFYPLKAHMFWTFSWTVCFGHETWRDGWMTLGPEPIELLLSEHKH